MYSIDTRSCGTHGWWICLGYRFGRHGPKEGEIAVSGSSPFRRAYTYRIANFPLGGPAVGNQSSTSKALREPSPSHGWRLVQCIKTSLTHHCILFRRAFGPTMKPLTQDDVGPIRHRERRLVNGPPEAFRQAQSPCPSVRSPRYGRGPVVRATRPKSIISRRMTAVGGVT